MRLIVKGETIENPPNVHVAFNLNVRVLGSSSPPPVYPKVFSQGELSASPMAWV